MRKLKEVATSVWIELIESFRSRVAIPFSTAFLIAIALCTSIDLASELSLQIATGMQLHRYAELVSIDHGKGIEICFARLCVDGKCFNETPVLAVRSLGHPCIGRGLAKALGIDKCIVVMEGLEIEVTRLCPNLTYSSYVAIPIDDVPKGARCMNASFSRIDVVEGLATYVARELSDNLLMVKLAILASYVVITIPTTTRLLHGLRDCATSLRIVGVPTKIVRISTAITALILATIATALGISIATVAIHAASTVAKAIGVYVVTRPMPSATSVATYLAYSATTSSISVLAMSRGRSYG